MRAAPRSAHLSPAVGPRDGVRGAFEEHAARSGFDHAATPLAHPADRDGVRQAPCLREVVGHEEDRVAALEAGDECLDDTGGEGVEGAAG